MPRASRVLASAATCLFLASAIAPAHSEVSPPFLKAWGQLGTGPGEFQSCSDVAAGVSGKIYVADFANKRIQRFQADGTFIDAWPTQPIQSAAVLPRSIAVDQAEHVFVLDQEGGHVQEYTSTGQLVTTWGGMGSSDGQLLFPAGIAVGPEGHVYVADSNNHRIQEFTSAGVHVRTLGSTSNPPLSFGLLGGIALDDLGNIFVTQLSACSVVKLAPSGTVLQQWGMQGSADASFDAPGDLCTDQGGNVYVSEQVFPPFQPSNHRVQKFANNGLFLTGWGGLGTGPGQFNDPHGIGVDSQGNIYVADTKNNRVQEFGIDASVDVLLSDVEARVMQGSVEVRWRASSSAGVTFAIWRAESPGDASQRIGEIRANPGERNLSFVDASIRPMADYDYRLAYRESAGWVFSQPIRVSTKPGANLRLAVEPNPARGGAMRLEYSIPREGHARIDVFSVTGARVRTLVDRRELAGTASWSWNGLDWRGVPVPAGRYFIRLATNGRVRTQSLVILR